MLRSASVGSWVRTFEDTMEALSQVANALVQIREEMSFVLA